MISLMIFFFIGQCIYITDDSNLTENATAATAVMTNEELGNGGETIAKPIRAS